MAKKFVGFKPEVMQKKILPALGYKGAMDQKSINQFLAARPEAAAMMGQLTLAARQMVEGKPIQAATGLALHNQIIERANQVGTDFGGRKNTTKAQKLAQAKKLAEIRGQANVTNQQASPTTTPASSTPASATPTGGVTNTPVTGGQGTSAGSQMTKKITADPMAVASRPPVAGNTPEQLQAGQTVSTRPEQEAAQAEALQAEAAGDALGATATPAAQAEAAQAQGQVQAVAKRTRAEEGEVRGEAMQQAAQADPTQASALGLQAAQAGPAQTVDAPDPLQVTPDQLISGSAVDMEKVDTTFGTGEVEAATVRDELDDLMTDFEGGKTPSWAAGAMRQANAAMAARGLSASSMAGMAVVQAAMEAALPIAQADASNKQQMALLKAEQRARFMGMEFDQEFQTKVKNAARISEIADINFSAEQQVALENARMAQTVNLANLDNRQAKIMADAATMSQMDLANLDNRQKANAQRANAFLQMDMQNLSNKQQTSLFKAQEQINSILSDTAATNAANQFNATSQNQTDQFFATMATQVEQFNVSQNNAMARFNAGEANALEQFNVQQENAREQFNTNNHLLIQQANAQWAQKLTTAENAAANQANREQAIAANNLTVTAYNNVIQQERDVLSWAWKSADGAMDRDANIAIAKIQANKDAGSKSFLSGALGDFFGTIASNAADLIFR